MHEVERFFRLAHEALEAWDIKPAWDKVPPSLGLKPLKRHEAGARNVIAQCGIPANYALLAPIARGLHHGKEKHWKHFNELCRPLRDMGIEPVVFPAAREVELAKAACPDAKICPPTIQDFEVCIADDGSTKDTQQIIENFQQNSAFPILHAWQDDRGFRAASARNNAVRMSSGDYLLFLDGDCIPRPNWIQQHLTLSEKHAFVAGNRVLLDETLSHAIETHRIPFTDLFGLNVLRHKEHINRLIPLLKIPLGSMRKLKPTSWAKVRTCNLGIWRQDFLAVNGFDEAYEGWGFEDSDLAIRLINLGMQRKLGLFATTVFHLYHRENDRHLAGINRQRLEQRLQNKITLPEKGLL